MRTNSITIIVTVFCCLCACDLMEEEQFANKITGINPLTYTDVVYFSNKDSALVSTFSGRIALKVKEDSKEYLITQINDEIYALQYSKKRKEVIAATKKSGILVIDVLSGKIKRSIKLKKKWTISLSLSNDENRLLAFDISGNNYLWDCNNRYKEIKLNNGLSSNFVRLFDSNNKIYLSGRGVVNVWSEEGLKKKVRITGKLVDVDALGNLLLLDFNKYIKYDVLRDTVAFTKTHPSWIRTLPSEDTIHDTSMKMKLTAARFVKDKIVSAGIDRSLRIWDSETGKLISEFTDPIASITNIDVSQDQKQIVIADAKGGVYFLAL